MFIDPKLALDLAHERGARLRAQAESDRMARQARGARPRRRLFRWRDRWVRRPRDQAADVACSTT